jgi:tripeptidyl-peptidase-1
MRVLFLLSLALAVLGQHSWPSREAFEHVKHEERQLLSPQWQKRSSVAEEMGDFSGFNIRIAVKHQNLHLAEKHVLSVSHPDSASFGQHWTNEQIAEEFAPSDESVSAVRHWLMEEGVKEEQISYSADKSWIKLRTTFQKAQDLLRTQYYVFEEATTGDKRIACDTYLVPTFVQPHIDFITPTIHTRELMAKRSAASNPQLHPGQMDVPQLSYNDLTTYDLAVTPNCIRALYNIPILKSSNPKNSLGVIELNPLSRYSQIDLDLFFQNFTKSLVRRPPQIISIDSGDPRYTDPFTFFDELAEADMDLQLTMSLTYPLNVTIYSVSDNYIGGQFDTWLDALDASYCSFEGGDVLGIDPIYPDNSTEVPGMGTPYNQSTDCGSARSSYVYSLSLAALEGFSSTAYETRMCIEFMKLTLQGSTFLFASDDYGVGAPDVIGCGGPNGTSFTPAFPATCPWVTAVGGSAINTGNTVYDPETSYGASGGGFSNIFPMPEYQSEAVLNWFKNNPTDYPQGTFNNSRKARAIPDMAANAWQILVATNGNFTLLGGTSASVCICLQNRAKQTTNSEQAPIAASIIALINDARLNTGKGPVGFINPVIYANPHAFNDIVTGNNPGCGTDGFNATKGWDPITGLGTPNYEKLLKIFMALP